MKKTNWLWSLLLVCVILLVACKAGDGEIPTDTDFESESESDVYNELLPYDLKYISNGDGTCYVSEIVTNPLYTDSFVITVPKTAPNGDRITEVRNPTLERYAVPQLITAVDFSEIEERLLAKVTAGELHQHYYNKFCAYFILHSCSGLSERAQEALLVDYPFAALTDFWILDLEAADQQMQFLQEKLDLIGYTTQDLMEDEANFRAIIEQSNLENKEKVLQDLPKVSEHLGHGIQGIELAQGLERIGEGAFANLTNLRTVVFPNSLTHIEAGAFYGCTSLTSVTLPNSVTSIDDSAFEGCVELTSIMIPNGVTSIGRYVFDGCTGLTSIVIPDSVTSIDEYAFRACMGLTSITVQEGNSRYHSAGNCLIETESKTLLAGCQNSVIPTDGSVTSIGDEAFSGCKSLTNITIPDSVTRIGQSAFFNCTGLTSITIPNRVTSIGDEAFSGCKSLTNITIPDSVTRIGQSAFFNCTGLTSITIPNRVTSIGYGTFRHCTKLTTIYYSGTSKDWSTTTVGSHNDSLHNATVYYYTETQPTTEGNYWHYVDGAPTAW